MAISVVQTKTFASSSPSGSVASTWNSNTTTGNLIIVAIADQLANQAANPVTSVTDSQGNTYNHATNFPVKTQGVVDFWYAYNITGGTTPTVTVTINSGYNSWAIAVIIREYAGLLTTNPFDVSTVNSGNSNSLTSGFTGTTTQASELVVGIASQPLSNPTFTVGSGYGNLTQISGVPVALAIEDKTVASTGAQQATFSSSNSWPWACGVATFKAVSGGGGGGSVAKNLSALGVG